MSKVMIVEDDDSLREIYGIRLTAEGYTVVSAHDGEEALAVAVRERPDLVISDVMMPKISGFDMLDILRSTPETQNIRVIMMTALSSEDQRERGENLGADRYLVKSQVGIEDVINVVHEVLGDKNADGTINTTVPQAQDTSMINETPEIVVAEASLAPAADVATQVQPEMNAMASQAAQPVLDDTLTAMQSSAVPQSDASQQPQVATQPDLPQQSSQDPVLNSTSQDSSIPPFAPNAL